MNQFLFGIAGYLCWYAAASWLPLPTADAPSYITQLILDPVRFLAAMIVFSVGFISHGYLIKITAEYYIHTQAYFTMEAMKELLVASLFVLLYYVMLQNRLILTLFFLVFSSFYGIISIERKRQFEIEREQ